MIKANSRNLRGIKLWISLSIILLSLAISCSSQESEQSKDYFITWDESSIVCISEEGGYPRLIRLENNTLVAVFEDRTGSVKLKESTDECKTWSDPIAVYDSFVYTDDVSGNTTKVNIANPEITQLANGDLLLACNLRPQKEGIYPFSISLKRSTDNGKTWGEEQILYKAADYFGDGCWEPSFLILPDNSIQIYFANESPYPNSNEQEISVLTSTDNGIKWTTEPTTVSFRSEFRDGMPVAVHDGKQIFVSIEDNVSGQFKPYIISSNIDNSWSEPVLSNSNNRYNALEVTLADSVYAGAPYLIRTNSDIYVLSYQTTENRTSEWEHSTMEVVISQNPYSFKNPSQPFKVPLSKEAKWNSLSYLGNNTIAALATTNFNSNKIGVWLIKGKISQK